MPCAPRITGTFLDEITHDIPSQNWGREDWRREFELYSQIGIDTVIIIRAGYRNRCIFPARSIPDLLPVYEDLGRVFFELAEEFGIGVWFGTYDSGHWWMRSTWWKIAAGLMPWLRPSFICAPRTVAPKMCMDETRSSPRP